MNIEKIMNRYGRTVCAVDGNGKKIAEKRCFIQPLRYKNKMYLEGTPTEIGVNEAGYFLFIAPATMDLESIGNNGYLYDDEKRYHIDRWEKIWVGDKVFYLWAILKERSEGKYPVYDHFVERR